METIRQMIREVGLTPIILMVAAIGIVLLGIHFLSEITAPMPEEPVIAQAAQPEIRVVTPKPVEPPVPQLGFFAVFTVNGQLLIYEAVKGDPVYMRDYVEYTNTEGVDRRWGGGIYFYSRSPFRPTMEAAIKTMTATQFREH